MAIGQVSGHLIRIRLVGIADESPLGQPWILDKVRRGLAGRLGREKGQAKEQAVGNVTWRNHLNYNRITAHHRCS